MSRYVDKSHPLTDWFYDILIDVIDKHFCEDQLVHNHLERPRVI